MKYSLVVHAEKFTTRYLQSPLNCWVGNWGWLQSQARAQFPEIKPQTTLKHQPNKKTVTVTSSIRCPSSPGSQLCKPLESYHRYVHHDSKTRKLLTKPTTSESKPCSQVSDPRHRGHWPAGWLPARLGVRVLMPALGGWTCNVGISSNIERLFQRRRAAMNMTDVHRNSCWWRVYHMPGTRHYLI